MWLIANVGIVFMKIIYSFMKLFRTQNKIVFISRQTNNLSLDYKMLKKELEKEKDIKLVFLTKKVEKRFSAVFSSIFIMFKQMYHLATSRLCIVDGYNITVSVLKHKKSLRVIQIWHSLGAIKKFGHQSLNTERKKKLAKIFKMHENYDYIITGSKAMNKYFAQAFNYPEEKLVPLGLPRIDYIKNTVKKNKSYIYKKYPEFKNKKIILYVPTFRDNDNYQINELIDAVDLNKYILIVKIHPNMHYQVESKKNVYTCKGIPSLDLLSIANYVITDYSAISIEAAVIDKPVYLYVYDYKEYSNNPGINTDLYKDLPGCVFEDPNELFKSLTKTKYNQKVIENFKKCYIDNEIGKVTKNLVKFIKDVYNNEE